MIASWESQAKSAHILFYADWHATIFCWLRVVLLALLQGDFRQLSTPSCFAKIAVRPSTPNLKNPLQITSSRVKQLVQKLASTLANRYENWCVTNFAGTN